MKIRIDKNNIRHWKDVPFMDAEGNPTGEVRDVLQLDIAFPDYPEVGTYGLNIDFPLTKPKVLQEIKTLALRVKEQRIRDLAIRQQIEDMGYLEFDVSV